MSGTWIGGTYHNGKPGQGAKEDRGGGGGKGRKGRRGRGRGEEQVWGIGGTSHNGKPGLSGGDGIEGGL